MKYIFLIQIFIVSTVNSFAQKSQELELKKGFKEIKIDNLISSVSVVKRQENSTKIVYTYTGDSKTLFYVSIKELLIETDKLTSIKKIKLYLDSMKDETFFSLLKSLKGQFGKASYYETAADDNKGDIAWTSSNYYMEFIHEYTGKGIWNGFIVIGRLDELDNDIKKILTGDNDGF